MAEDREPKTDSSKGESPSKSTADDLFEDMGRKVAEMALQSDTVEAVGTDDANEQKMVEEIESFCVNCHDEVCSKRLGFRLET